MELKFIRELIGTTKGVDGYVVMDLNGTVQAQDLGPYANKIKRTEFATWILNCFYAIDSYYPQAFCLLFQYASGHIYLTRTDNRLITVMCRHGADVLSIENALSQHRNAMAKSNSSGVVREKSKKGETVFLKISETGAGATASPIPQKQSGPPIGLIIGGLVALGAVIGGILFFMGGKDPASDPSETPSVAQSQQAPDVAPPAQPEPAKPDVAAEQFTQSTAAIARDRSAALAKIAQQQNAGEQSAMNMARALANSQNALQQFNNGQYKEATQLWNQSAEFYGQAAVQSAEKNFNAALNQAGMRNVAQYPSTMWIEVENIIRDAKANAAEGNHTDAVASIMAQTAKLPQLKQDYLKKLNDLAAQAAQRNNFATALNFYEEVVAIDPTNQTALDYIYRHRYDPGEIMKNSVGMQLAYIPPGEFMRGSPEDEVFRDADEIQAKVTITKGFFMATTEVSQGQWEKVMGQRIRMANPDSDFMGDNLPAHSITWEQALEFCLRLSEKEGKTYRLPTEAEWEYAARAQTTTPYNIKSARLTSRDANVYDPAGEGLDTIAAVGSVGQPNQWGLYDMHGNVAEWTADWYAPYPEGDQVDPMGPEDIEGRIDLAMKIVRGGSYIDDAHFSRSANRSEAAPVVANNYIGFRPVLDLADF